MKKKIKIGLHTYKIVQEKLREDYAYCDLGANVIHLDPSYVESKIELCLAHEIIHALLEESGLREIVSSTEESYVRILENTFYTFLKQNTNFYD